MRKLGRLSNLLAIATWIAVGLLIAFATPTYLLGTLSGDDAGYYLAIARNFVLGHGFSFDRLHATNGFNPLLPLLLIPLDRVLAPGLEVEACFRIGLLVTWVALGWSFLSLRSLGRRVLAAAGLPEDVAYAANGALALFVAGFVALKGYYAMDAFLVLALGVAYFERVSRVGLLANGWRAAMADAVFLAGTVLARVDSLPLVAAAFAMMLPVIRSDRRAWTGLAARALCVAALLVPYLLWNRLGFGDWLPISARIKTAFPTVDLAASLDTILHSSLNMADQAAVALALVAALVWCATWLSRRPGVTRTVEVERAWSAMNVWALYLAARLSWLVLFSRFDVQGSYFILAHPFIALSAVLGARAVAGAQGVRAAIVLIMLAAAALALAKLRVTEREVRAIAAGQGDEWAIARRVHDATSAGDVIYGGAYGLIGFIADRAWENGDGVANDRDYQDAIRNHRLAERLARDGVDLVAVTVPGHWDPGTGASLTLTIRSALYGVNDTLHLDAGGVVLRERMRRGGGTELLLVRNAP